jgi:leucyl-tRNA synthetase
MINQGMILGESAFVNRVHNIVTLRDSINRSELGLTDAVKESVIKRFKLSGQYYISDFENKEEREDLRQIILEDLIKDHPNEVELENAENFLYFMVDVIPANVDFVNRDNELDIDAFKSWRKDAKDAKFYPSKDGIFKVSREVEKMSKSKYNVVSPDDICEQYGADTLRLYEMFLGPLEQAKPWNTAGITGVYGFIKKLWKLYHNDAGFSVSDEKASPDSMKTLHKAIKKTQDDIENFSFNTSVSSFMIAVNELTAQKGNSREVLEPLAILVSPYAPHIAEELWSLLGHKESISEAPFPIFDEKYLVESSKTYPISFNGKMKFTLDLPVAISKDELEKMVLANEKVQEQLEGKQIRKTIIVPGKIVNFVVG